MNAHIEEMVRRVDLPNVRYFKVAELVDKYADGEPRAGHAGRLPLLARAPSGDRHGTRGADLRVGRHPAAPHPRADPAAPGLNPKGALRMASPAAPRPSAKQRLSRFLPGFLIEWLDGLVFRVRRTRIRAVQGLFGLLGFNMVKRKDYYSTLPGAGRDREDPRAMGPAELAHRAWSSTCRVCRSASASSPTPGRHEFRQIAGDYLPTPGAGSARATRSSTRGRSTTCCASTSRRATSRSAPACRRTTPSLAARAERRRGLADADHLHRALPVRRAAHPPGLRAGRGLRPGHAVVGASRSSKPATCSSSTPRTR